MACGCCLANGNVSRFLLRFSHSNLHPAAEPGAAVSSPRSPAQAQRAAAEAAGGRGGPGGEDEAAAGSQ